MNILDQIHQQKLVEVKLKKEMCTTKQLEKSIYFESKCVSLKKYITDSHRSGIIAEFKRKSPSKGFINKYANAENITIGYMQAGASALSVLTDETFFGANSSDFTTARKYNYCPILRKDFIIDEFQIIETKSIGADAVLLIAKLLTPKKLKELYAFSKQLGLEVLVEYNSQSEIQENENVIADLVGINNRDLSNFSINIDNSIQLASLIDSESVLVSESGLDDIATIQRLKQHGFKGFLMGEYFMKQPQPAEACKQFIKNLQLCK